MSTAHVPAGAKSEIKQKKGLLSKYESALGSFSLYHRCYLPIKRKYDKKPITQAIVRTTIPGKLILRQVLSINSKWIYESLFTTAIRDTVSECHNVCKSMFITSASPDFTELWLGAGVPFLMEIAATVWKLKLSKAQCKKTKKERQCLQRSSTCLVHSVMSVCDVMMIIMAHMCTSAQRLSW